MIIKKFTGKTKQDAETEALRKLGAKAIILHNRQIQPSVEGESQEAYEVTAAIEEQDHQFSPSKDYTLEEIEKIIDNIDFGVISSSKETPTEFTEERTENTEPLFSNLCNSLWGELSKEDNTPFEDLVHHLSKATKPSWQPKSFIVTSYGLKNFLIERGIDDEIAEALMKKVEERFRSLDFSQPTPDRDEAIRFLYKELTDAIHIFGPIIFDRTDAKVIALVGSSGAGKSMTAAKLAYQYARQLNKRVMIITLEKESGLQGYKKIPQVLDEKISLNSASNKLDLQRLVSEQRNHQDLIIIDAFNCSQRSWDEMDKLINFLALPCPVEVHLVVSALTKDADAIKIFQNYSPLSPASFIITKIKETTRPGLAVNLCVNCDLPVSYLTSDADIATPLEIAEAGSLARQLLLTTLK